METVPDCIGELENDRGERETNGEEEESGAHSAPQSAQGQIPAHRIKRNYLKLTNNNFLYPGLRWRRF